jgi:phage terminase large subunit GpA-like protein
MSDRRWLADMLHGMVPERFAGSMVEYFDGTLRLPHSTRYPVYIAEESPWLIEPMRAANDSAVKRVDVRGPAGAAKSLIGEMHIAWCVDNDPGLYYYVHQSDPDGVDAMEDRILPMLQANDFLAKRLPNDRHKQRIAKIAFPHMSLYCVGANMSAAQSKRVKFLTMEEPHMYKPGMMSAFEKRCEGVRNAKILTLSTGSVLGDESDNAFQSGTCEEWQVPCPHCRQFQRMTDGRDRLIYTQGEKTTDENGQYNWKDILPTVRYNCEHCGRDWPSDEASRRAQAQQGRYEATNPNAPEWHRSFHWEAAAVHYFHLGSLLMEKLKASYAAKAGQIEPLRDYIQKRRALAWDESPTDADGDLNFERMKGQYLKGDKFEGEICRFLTIDNQAGRASKGEGAHRWYVCRAYGEKEARIIDEGRITTWEELEEKRIALEVEPGRTLVDIAFDTMAVQEVIVRYGWTGLWGDNTNRRDFPHHEMANGQRITRKYPFSPVNVGHVGIGTDKTRRQARYFFWAQQPVKSMYHRLRSGMSTYRFTAPQDVSSEYQKQTAVEFKRQEVNRDGSKKWTWTVMKGRANHLLDCDQMNLVAAMLDARLRSVLFTTEAQAPETDLTTAKE